MADSPIDKYLRTGSLEQSSWRSVVLFGKGGRRLRVEVDEQGPKAPGGEDGCQVHGGRRLADAALVVGNSYRAHGSRPL